MINYRGHLILLPPNRVWRPYTGGKTLDILSGAAEPRDSHKHTGSISVYAFALFLISASARKIEQTLNSHTGVDTLLLTLV